MFRSCVRVRVFLIVSYRGEEERGWVREYEIKGGVWFPTKNTVFLVTYLTILPLALYTWK